MIIRFNHRADNSDIWISGIASPIDSLAAIPVRRVALCLHGRIGIWRVRASHIDDAEVVWKANAPHRWREAPKHMDRIDVAEHTALVGFATFGHSSLYRHVVAPNRAAGIDIDVFLHSWHAEIGLALDAMYRPVASKHELVKHNLHPVRSQHLSMRTVLALVAASGRHYDMTMMLRYDLLFFRPFLLARLGTRTPLWLPHWCQRYPLSAQAGMLVRAACGNWPGHGEGYVVQPPTSVGVAPTLRGRIHREANFDYAYLDWWFIAKPEVAQTWGEIYDGFENYGEALKRVAKFPQWGHFYWAHHINKRLRLRHDMRFILYEGRDFRLARHWHLGTHCMHFLGPAATLGAPSSAAATALEALATLSVDPAVFFRCTQRRSARGVMSGSADEAIAAASWHDSVMHATGLFSGNASARHGLQLSRQCPLDARIRLYCPWSSPVCPAKLRAAVLDIEAAAQVAVEASSRLPKWPLFGDSAETVNVRRDGRVAQNASQRQR